MKNTKYELVKDDIKLFNGRTLYRIRALVSIGLTVNSGDLGGYIESEKNLSIGGNALVSGDARVFGDALVFGNAQVSGDALVANDKSIFWASKVGKDNATLTVFQGKEGLIVTRGCFIGTTGEFLTQSKEVHDEETHWEYKLLLLVAENRIKKGNDNEQRTRCDDGQLEQSSSTNGEASRAGAGGVASSWV